MSRKLKLYEKVLLYGCIGLAVEVIFTAFADPSWSMKGYSYLWMFVVWPAGFFALGYASDHVRSFHFLSRALVYAAICFAVEYAFAMLFKYTLGGIPWDYSYTLWHVNGAIRLDYLPFWALAGLASEIIIRFMNRLRVHYDQ